MANTLLDRVQMTVSGTPGTGTITLGSAVSGFQTFAAAGATVGMTIPYLIVDGSNWEFGVGTYGASTTLARTSITASSNSGSAISATTAAIVTATLRAADVPVAPVIPTLTSTGLASFVHNSQVVSNVSNGILVDARTATTSELAGMTMNAPGTPYTITAQLVQSAFQNAYESAVLGWYNGTDKIHAIGITANGIIEVEKWNSYNSFNATDIATTSIGNNTVRTSWLQIRDDGTNVYFRLSGDGVTFVQFYTVAKSSGWLTGTGYTKIFVGGSANGFAQAVTLTSWTVGA